MAIVLQLKRRKEETRQVPVDNVLAFLRGPLSDTEKVQQLRESLSGYKSEVHDKAWLSNIVNFAPEGGMPLTEQAPWLRLATRVAALDDEREGPFTLSTHNVELIWKRLNDPKFKMARLHPAWAAFVLDFCEAAGKSFGGDVDTEEVSDA